MRSMHFAVVMAVVFVAGPVAAARQGEIDGNVYRIAVDEGVTVTMNQDDVSALADDAVTELQKTGAGTLVAASLPGFTGTIRIKSGVYRVDGVTASPFGSVAGATIVEAGATVLFTGVKGSTDQYSGIFTSEPFELAGTGFEGAGALCLAAENNCINNYVYLGNLKLVSDTLVTAPKVNDGDRGGARNSGYFCYLSGTFDMGGYTFETACSGNTEFRGITIENPGDFISGGSGQFYIHSAANFNHGKDHRIYLNSAAYLSFYNNALPNGFNWTVVCNADVSTIYFDKGPVTFAGNIEIPQGKKCKLQSTVDLTITGDITGGGSVETTCTRLCLAGDNSFEGAISGGNVIVASPTAVPDFSKCSSGVLGVGLAADDGGIGMTGAEFGVFAETPETGGAFLEGSYVKRFYVQAGDAVEIDADPSAWNATELYNDSEGTVVFTKAVTGDMKLVHTGTAGGFRFSNPDGDVSEIGTWTVSRGRMEIFDANVDKSNNTFYCCAPSGQSTHTVISNSLFRGYHYGDGSKKFGPFSLGSGRGDDTIEILADSVVSNSVIMGALSGSSSAFYLRDGFFALMKNYNADSAIGEYGTGYFEQTGGECSIVNHCHLGHRAGSVGLHYMSGGMLTVAGMTYNVGQSGNAVFHQSGGTFKTPHLFYVGSSAYESGSGAAAAQNLKHVWTLEGEGTVAECSNDAGIRMVERNNAEAVINLNSGARLTTPKIVRSRGYAESNGNILPSGGFYSNDFAYVNFNGGTLRASSSGFLGDDSVFSDRGTASTRVIAKVYEGGARIETVNYIALKTPLEDAPGQGVVEIPMPEGAVTTGLNAPPYVNISGDGSNATAVATFDSKTRTWTGFKITSPGFNYTQAKAQIFVRGSKAYEVDCVLAENKPGPVHFFVDREANSNSELCIKCAMTYTGPTRITGRVWFDGGSLASRDIMLDAGANFFAEASVNGANIHGSGDVYNNWSSASFTADGDSDGICQVYLTLTVGERPVVKLVNLATTDGVVDDQVVTVLRTGSKGTVDGIENFADAVIEGVPEGYRAWMKVADGIVSVRVRKITGFGLILR